MNLTEPSLDTPERMRAALRSALIAAMKSRDSDAIAALRTAIAAASRSL